MPSEEVGRLCPLVVSLCEWACLHSLVAREPDPRGQPPRERAWEPCVFARRPCELARRPYLRSWMPSVFVREPSAFGLPPLQHAREPSVWVAMPCSPSATPRRRHTSACRATRSLLRLCRSVPRGMRFSFDATRRVRRARRHLRRAALPTFRRRRSAFSGARWALRFPPSEESKRGSERRGVHNERRRELSPLRDARISPCSSGIRPCSSGIPSRSSGIPPCSSGIPPRSSGIPTRSSGVRRFLQRRANPSDCASGPPGLCLSAYTLARDAFDSSVTDAHITRAP
jgi:hypothetical protein